MSLQPHVSPEQIAPGHANTHLPAEPGIVERSIRGVVGLGLAAAPAFIGYQALTHHDTPDALRYRLNIEVGADAKPSDDLARYFDYAMGGAAVFGGLVLVGAGIRQAHSALSPRHRAVANLAYKGKPGNGLRKALATSAIPVFSGTIFGFAADIGNAVGGSQVDALRPLVAALPEDTTMLSNSGKPELATTPILSNTVVENLFATKEQGGYEGVDIIPIRYSWESVTRDSDNQGDGTAPKILSVVMSLPREITGLPDEDPQCKTIPVNAASALGKPGDKIHMAGATFTIAGELDGSGPNIVPIAMNDTAYARCFASNPEQPYNLVALRGKPEIVARFLKAAKVLNTDDTTKRVKKSTLRDFLSETDQTSKNNSNGLIFVFAIGAAAAAAGSLAYKVKADFANNRSTNSMLAAGGLSNKAINQIAKNRADREALLSSVYAMPLVAAMDLSTALSTPGAVNVAPNALTYLTVLGVLTAVGRAATAIVAPSEIHKLNPARRGTQQ